jgi:hypothetical protein
VATGDFLAQHLGLHPAVPGDAPDEALLSADDRCLTAWPATALDADRLAQQLTGRRVGANLKLWDVFPPQASPQALQQDLTPRGSTRQILAQFEAFLQPPR